MTDPQPTGGPTGVLRMGTEDLRSLAVRWRDVVVITAAVGVATGLGVAVVDRITIEVLLERAVEAPMPVRVLLPGLGLVLTALVLWTLGGGASPSTAEEYVKGVTHSDRPFPIRAAPARILGAILTLGLGGAGGMEGPAIYLGSSTGAVAFRRLRRGMHAVDRRAVLAAGAAAGVAAVFKAPATGAVFALEVPFQDDMAPRSVLPALVGAASGFTSYALVNGADALLPVEGHRALVVGDLLVAALIGLACGVGARVFAAVMGAAKDITTRVSAPLRIGLAAVVLGALVATSAAWFDDLSLSMGPGYETIHFALDPDRGLWILVALATVRVLSTATVVAGSGVAGMFVPLVVQGALTGRLLAEAFGRDDESLWVVVGVAAFLGAGYRVPLAAVMFTAEATGRPGFIVPGLIASTVGQLVMGTASVSAHQQRRRDGYLEQRAGLAITEVLSTDAAVAQGDATVAELFTEHVALARRRAVPVVDDDGRYEGLVVLDDVLRLEPERWSGVSIADIARTDVPVGGPDWTLGQALRVMLDAEVDHLPVVDAAGHLRGVVTSEAIIDRAELADRLEGGRA